MDAPNLAAGVLKVVAAEKLPQCICSEVKYKIGVIYQGVDFKTNEGKGKNPQWNEECRIPQQGHDISETECTVNLLKVKGAKNVVIASGKISGNSFKNDSSLVIILKNKYKVYLSWSKVILPSNDGPLTFNRSSTRETSNPTGVIEGPSIPLDLPIEPRKPDLIMSSVISSLNAFVKVLDAVADIHPIVRAISNVIILGWDIFISQIEKHKKIAQLWVKIKETYIHVQELESEKFKRENTLLSIKTLTCQTYECIIFLRDLEYKKAGLLATLTNSTHEKIDSFIVYLEKLRINIDSNIALELWQGVRGVGGGLELLGRKIDRYHADDRLTRLITPLPKVPVTWNKGRMCVEGTRLANIDFITKWINNASSTYPSALWLHGNAGSGKTRIVNSVANIYHQLARLPSTFYFKKGNDANIIFRHLLHDLALFSPAIYERFSKDSIASSFVTRPLRNQAETLRTVLSPDIISGPLLIIIDGLDSENVRFNEDDNDSTLEDILEGLCDIIKGLPIGFKLLLSGREETIVQDILSTLSPGILEKHNIDIADDDVLKADLRCYYSWSSRRGMVSPEELGNRIDDIVDYVVKDSGGNYALAIKRLNEEIADNCRNAYLTANISQDQFDPRIDTVYPRQMEENSPYETQEMLIQGSIHPLAGESNRVDINSQEQDMNHGSSLVNISTQNDSAREVENVVVPDSKLDDRHTIRDYEESYISDDLNIPPPDKEIWNTTATSLSPPMPANHVKSRTSSKGSGYTSLGQRKSSAISIGVKSAGELSGSNEEIGPMTKALKITEDPSVCAHEDQSQLYIIPLTHQNSDAHEIILQESDPTEETMVDYGLATEPLRTSGNGALQCYAQEERYSRFEPLVAREISPEARDREALNLLLNGPNSSDEVIDLGNHVPSCVTSRETNSAQKVRLANDPEMPSNTQMSIARTSPTMSEASSSFDLQELIEKESATSFRLATSDDDTRPSNAARPRDSDTNGSGDKILKQLDEIDDGLPFFSYEAAAVYETMISRTPPLQVDGTNSSSIGVGGTSTTSNDSDINDSSSVQQMKVTRHPS